jgi:penicillin-binding protein 1A
MGAAYRDMVSGSRGQGASTLTMQLSRNLFLSPERSWGRKVQEIMLSIQIERRFTKPQIFALYANQIFLGGGAYGFEAGAGFYFSKHARELNLEEAALLAALPKGPSEFSPVRFPERALRRRNLVINSMLEDGKITKEEADRAKAAPLALRIQTDPNSVAPYFVEEVRRYLEKKYGSEQVHEQGLRVFTSINLDWQQLANRAVLDGLATYERRHGWKGGLPNVLDRGERLDRYTNPDWNEPVGAGSYVHGLVTAVSGGSATVKVGRIAGSIAAADAAWAAKGPLNETLKRGDIVYARVLALDGPVARLALEQDSGAQGALLCLDNTNGDVKAMVGGRDFDESKFNRATQALRQVGSSFKPYVYTAAVEEEGAEPDDHILDAPTTFMTASGPYTPHNYDGKFKGTITLRYALAESRNIPALKLAQKVGMHKVIEYAHRFGITSKIEPYLPVALGSAEVTLQEQTAAFTTFPNDGVRVVPRYIRKVEDYEGHVLEDNYPEVKDVIPAATARTMVSLLRGVVQMGTAASANAKLNKHPLGGKTGTTNDFTDAWFVGFSPSITAGVWVGFDEKKSLGNKETGAEAALPIWIDFMKVALAGRDKEVFPGDEPAAEESKPALKAENKLAHPKAAGAQAR